MRSISRFYFTSFVICIVFLFTSCSTKKNTLVTRSYHNLTSRYNGYFYANESVKEGVENIEKGYKYNFSALLPVFLYPDQESAQSIYPEMDKAIKKSSLVIQRHTITDRKGREIVGAVKWIDDNFMVIGKAHFYKRDFFAALESFDYVVKAYKKYPIRYNAMLWMIRTYNEMGSLSMSEPIIDLINNDKKFPKNLTGELAAISADYYIKRGNYPEAMKQLTKAIAFTRKKKTRSRYIFILAQLNEREKETKKASQYYAQVVRLNTSYDLTFNARINRAKLYDVNAGNIKNIKKELLKMLRDDKNIEYRDQIYYTLAEIDEKENNIPAAIDNLKHSVKASVSNPQQKALSFLKLADLYFEIPDYTLAQAYYDSTVAFLPGDFPNYELITSKKENLTRLVTHLNTVTREDSLQRIARMSEPERDAFIEKIIAKLEEEARKKQEEKENQQNLSNNFLNQNNTAPGNTNASGTSWYFYNPSAMSFGLVEFTKKWGNRKLEDNWRRSNKEMVIANPGDPNNPVDSISNPSLKANDIKNKETYLKNLPLSNEQLKKSDSKIIEALYSAGGIYKEQLLNNKKAADTFEELLKRYPENKYTLSSYYQLYRVYLSLGNTTKSDYYKNILLTKHADTEYARIIKNPDYNKETQASKNEVEKIYNETYALYANAKYADVVVRCVQVDTLYPKNFLMPKFDYLKALSIGRTQGINAFEKALINVTIRHPKDEVKDKAQEMLDIISSQKKTTSDSSNRAMIDGSVPKTYVFDKEANFYWVLHVPNQKGDINKFKIKLSDSNNEFYSNSQLNINNVFLDSATQVVIVKSFQGKDKALNYYEFMKNKPEVYTDLEPDSYQSFIISEENYALFYRQKNLREYLTFFYQNYF